VIFCSSMDYPGAKSPKISTKMPFSVNLTYPGRRVLRFLAQVRSKYDFFFVFDQGQPRLMPVTGAFPEKCVTTHRILAILLDDIEMLRDLFFKKKLAEKPKVSRGFRSVIGTGAWQKLKVTAAV